MKDDPDGVLVRLLSIVSALLRVRVSSASDGGARLLFGIVPNLNKKGFILLIVVCSWRLSEPKRDNCMTTLGRVLNVFTG